MTKKRYEIINDILTNNNFSNMDHTSILPLYCGNIPKFTCYQNLKENNIIIMSRLDDLQICIPDELFLHDDYLPSNYCEIMDLSNYYLFGDDLQKRAQYEIFCICKHKTEIRSVFDWTNKWEFKLLNHIIRFFKETNVDIVEILDNTDVLSIQTKGEFAKNIPGNFLDNGEIHIFLHYPNKKYKIQSNFETKINESVFQRNFSGKTETIHLIQMTILSLYEQQILKKSYYNDYVIKNICMI